MDKLQPEAFFLTRGNPLRCKLKNLLTSSACHIIWPIIPQSLRLINHEELWWDGKKLSYLFKSQSTRLIIQPSETSEQKFSIDVIHNRQQYTTDTTAPGQKTALLFNLLS